MSTKNRNPAEDYMVFIEDQPCLYLPTGLLVSEKYKGLSYGATLLYSIMYYEVLFASKLDSNGFPFIYFPANMVCKSLRCSKASANKYTSELVEAGLLISVRQGQGLPNRLYVFPVEL